MPTINSKLPGVGTTIFTVMSRMASDVGAINLSQGFPDFNVPPGLLASLHTHLDADHHQYAPMAGLPELCEAIAGKTRRLYCREIDALTEVTVTSGATSALFTAIEACAGPGDEVIVLDPAYDSYDPAIRLAGATPVHVPLLPGSFAIDFDRLASAMTSRTRMLVMNTPHNPTGAVVTADELDQLAGLLRKTNVIVLSDEVYEHMFFEADRHASLSAHAELATRSLVVSSFGKTYHCTGWKVGYVIAPQELMAEFRRVHQFVQFCVATPLQHALADYLESDPGHYENLPAFYRIKRDQFCTLLGESRFNLSPSAGTYFQLADYSEISDASDMEFSEWLTREAGVACIPVSVFQRTRAPDQRLVRFCFAKHEATLEQAAERLCAI